jgi:hypothetical protein
MTGRRGDWLRRLLATNRALRGHTRSFDHGIVDIDDASIFICQVKWASIFFRAASPMRAGLQIISMPRPAFSFRRMP